MPSPAIAPRAAHQRWLHELTAIPTAAGREERVVEWVLAWLKKRPGLALRRDRAGNLIITQKRSHRQGDDRRPAAPVKPIFITAHLDHPAFVVRRVIDGRTLELEFRGGVQDAYFENARIEIFDSADRAHDAAITALDSTAKPFKRVTAALDMPVATIRPGDVGRWLFADRASLPRLEDDLLHTFACDDLAAVAAALAALDVLRARRGAAHVGVLLTRSEEIGFVGAIAACTLRSVPQTARLICLENSRSFAESPIGAGPIVRVGDRISVFSPALTNRLSAIMTEHVKIDSGFKWQRKLMAGGACEATAFSSFGFESTCLCLPLGNYHNMAEIDAVQAGKRPARVAPEFISVSDFHGLVQMLVICCTQLDSAKIPAQKQRMLDLLKKHAAVVGLKA